MVAVARLISSEEYSRSGCPSTGRSDKVCMHAKKSPLIDRWSIASAPGRGETTGLACVRGPWVPNNPQHRLRIQPVTATAAVSFVRIRRQARPVHPALAAWAMRGAAGICGTCQGVQGVQTRPRVSNRNPTKQKWARSVPKRRDAKTCQMDDEIANCVEIVRGEICILLEGWWRPVEVGSAWRCRRRRR